MANSRLTTKKLHDMIRVSEQKIDILERRIASLEDSPRSPTEKVEATKDSDRGKGKRGPDLFDQIAGISDRARLRLALSRRASQSLLNGVGKASKDVGDSFKEAYRHLQNSESKDGGFSRQLRESTAAIQVGFEKAGRDIEHSAQRAMRIVQN